MGKTVGLRIVKIICFVLILAFLTLLFSIIMKPKNGVDYADQRSYETYRIFDENPNTVDVVFLGHSGLGCGISPMEMYKRYGFTSYVCASTRQVARESYNVLTEVLEEQTPQVVVIETDHLFYDQGLGLGKLQEIPRLTNWLPLLKNHVGWKEWLPGGENRERSELKGYRCSMKTNPFRGDSTLTPTENVYKMSKNIVKMLDNVLELCNQKRIKLMFLEVPSTIIWDYSKYNAIKQYADQHNLDFIDTNQKLDELGFDWTTDTFDAGDHLNYYGATKVSTYVGKFMQEKYALADRRNDEKYQTWKEDLVRYEATVSALSA